MAGWGAFKIVRRSSSCSVAVVRFSLYILTKVVIDDGVSLHPCPVVLDRLGR